MKFKMLAVVAALGLANSASAGGFDGVYIQGGVGFANAKTEISGTGSLLDGSQSQTSTIVPIAVGYSQSFGNINLAANIYTIIGDQKSGERNFISGVDTLKLKFKDTNTWGVNFEPGWNIDSSTLVYAKLGYTRTTTELTVIANLSGVITTATGDQSYDGFLYGLGAKFKFNQNVFGVAELQQSVFSEKDNVKPSSVAGMIGVGIKF